MPIDLVENSKPDDASEGYGAYSLPRAVPDVRKAADALRVYCAPFEFANLSKSIDDFVGNARIVALGEGSHGTSEYFQMQTDVARYLVENKNARSILIELPATFALRMTLHMNEGPAAIAKLIEEIPFETWKSSEFADFFEFAARWNSCHPGDQLSIVGVDFSTTGAVRCFEEMGRFGSREISEFGDLVDRFDKFYEDGCGKQLKNDSNSAMARAGRELLLNARSFAERFKDDGPAYRLIRSCAQVAKYTYGVFQEANQDGSLRDKIMASNAVEAIRELEVNQRAVVIGHNGHIGFGVPGGWGYSLGMGRYLREKYGASDYKVLTSTSGGGTLASRRPGSFVSEMFPSSPSPHGSLEEILALELSSADQGCRSHARKSL